VHAVKEEVILYLSGISDTTLELVKDIKKNIGKILIKSR
jgi:hypothetical protein